MGRKRGLTLLDESKGRRALATLDEIPPVCGFTDEHINRTLEESKLVEHHILWAEYLNEDVGEDKNCASLDILLPTGTLLTHLSPLHWSLSTLKEQVYRIMKKSRFGEDLKPVSDYIFYSVGDDGEPMELFDEIRSLNTIHMFLPILTLREPSDSQQENQLNRDINMILGLNIKNWDTNISEELHNFRLELFSSTQRAEDERGTSGTFHYAFPEETILPNIADRVFSPNTHTEVHEEDVEFWWYPNLPADAEKKAMQSLKKKIERSKIGIMVWYRETETDEHGQCVGIKDVFDKNPSDIISTALRLMDKKDNPADFILQVIGKRSYVTLHKPILKFEYIRSCFENYQEPKLLLRRKQVVFEKFPPPPSVFLPYFVRADRFTKTYPYTQLIEPVPFWSMDENMVVIIRGVSSVERADSLDIYLKVIISVGRHVLDCQRTELIQSAVPMNEELQCNIYLKDLPESAQVSFWIVGSPRKTTAEEVVGFVNIRLFNWRNMYFQGRHTLHLWRPPKGYSDDALLLFQHGPNPDHGAARVDVELPGLVGKELEYPNWDTIEKFATFVESRHDDDVIPEQIVEPILPGSKILEKMLNLRSELDGSKLSLEDQVFLWNARFKIQELFPQMILILADCPLVYKARETLCEFYTLLNSWPQLYVDTAIELLDARFTDRYVRAFAVRHLDRTIDNDQMRLYLLPLVQCLRYEPFATSPLADMLVRRSLMDYKVGHTFFWLMRSELALFDTSERTSDMCLRYAIMLEAYCRGNAEHLPSLIKQAELVKKLTSLSELIKAYPNKEAATRKLRQELVICLEDMQDMQSPLNPCDYLGGLEVDSCRVLGSAKMPLMLRWANPEPLAYLSNPVHEIIFKNGDDLRQDMLTLQVMRIMDAKWKLYNLDYCLTLYEVLPMGQNIGMIHVVQNCATLFQIQCSSRQLGSSFNMDQQLINKHIYDLCTQDKVLDSKKYMECVDRFSYSLAGYCVATYLLGIKDRHQDNIMLATDGRLFHIDFGHILGHNKKKLGINRERTDFILTDHFLCVVSHGKDDIRSSYMFKSFRDSCSQGYVVLHYHRRFFIALFKMMRCMGLPELQRDEDIAYLYTSLQYGETRRDEATNSFLSVFDAVVKSDLSTTINWFFHSVKHHK